MPTQQKKCVAIAWVSTLTLALVYLVQVKIAVKTVA